MRGLATGTAYFIPARVGVWLVWCGSWGPVGDSGLSLSLLSLAGGPVLFEVRFGRRGVAGCVLLSQIYKMSHRTYV